MPCDCYNAVTELSLTAAVYSWAVPGRGAVVALGRGAARGEDAVAASGELAVRVAQGRGSCAQDFPRQDRQDQAGQDLCRRNAGPSDEIRHTEHP